jgi:GntR family transcriptional regulator
MPSALTSQVVGDLHQLIDAYRKDGRTRFPPEVELSRELGVGRSTLREALALLEADGLIERKRRRGTTILPPRRPWGPETRAYPADLILALPVFLDERQIPFEVRQFSVRRESASNQVADGLGLAVSTDVYRVDRLYDIEGLPGAHLRHYFPTSLDGKPLSIGELREGATNFLSADLGLNITSSESVISAEAANIELSDAFGVPEGSPILTMYARLVAADLGAVALGRMSFRPDVVSLSVRAFDDIRPSLLA